MVAVISALAVVPLLFPANTVLNFFVAGFIVILFAQGWNILGGLAGQLWVLPHFACCLGLVPR